LVSWLQVPLVLIAVPLFAAESTVTGRVADENNTAVAEVRVALTIGAVSFRSTTDPTGAFHLRLPEGVYTVNAEHDGYFPLRERTVELLAGPQELNLTLNHLREVFESVKVEGAPQPLDIDQTTSQKTLSGLNVVNVPYPSTHDVRNAMKLMPGVVQDARGGLHFSGSEENQVLYTLDGFNVSDPVNGGFATRLSTVRRRPAFSPSRRRWGTTSCATQPRTLCPEWTRGRACISARSRLVSGSSVQS
jgi:hypothetical protein